MRRHIPTKLLLAFVMLVMGSASPSPNIAATPAPILLRLIAPAIQLLNA